MIQMYKSHGLLGMHSTNFFGSCGLLGMPDVLMHPNHFPRVLPGHVAAAAAATLERRGGAAYPRCGGRRQVRVQINRNARIENSVKIPVMHRHIVTLNVAAAVCASARY